MRDFNHRVTVIGGGHGLEATIRAAVLAQCEVTALVSVADDGGSSGRLRELYGLVPPGDLRRCLSALTPEGSLLPSLLEYRFDSGELTGHALGNLIFVAAEKLYGSSTAAMEAMGELFQCRGSVLPVADAPLTLYARLRDGEVVHGQVDVHMSSGIAEVWTEPHDVRISEKVRTALLDCDLVLLGPGSLYTSVLAAVVHSEMRSLLRQSPARKVFVANLCEQVNETVGLSIASQLDALGYHGIEPDVVVADCSYLPPGNIESFPGKVILGQFALETGTNVVHDPRALSAVIRELLPS